MNNVKLTPVDLFVVLPPPSLCHNFRFSLFDKEYINVKICLDHLACVLAPAPAPTAAAGVSVAQMIISSLALVKTLVYEQPRYWNIHQKSHDFISKHLKSSWKQIAAGTFLSPPSPIFNSG